MSEQSSSDEGGMWAAIIVGMVMAVPVVVVLSNQAPWVLLTAIVLGFLAWAGVRSGVLAREEAGDEEVADPLTTLQERYAAGDLSEAEFERRLDRILESEEVLRQGGEARGRSRPSAPTGDGGAATRDSEPATERE